VIEAADHLLFSDAEIAARAASTKDRPVAALLKARRRIRVNEQRAACC